MATYRTIDGDVLDHICLKHYGQVTGIEEQVLNANPHIADLAPIFKAGVLIELPELDVPKAANPVVSLWS